MRSLTLILLERVGEIRQNAPKNIGKLHIKAIQPHLQHRDTYLQPERRGVGDSKGSGRQKDQQGSLNSSDGSCVRSQIVEKSESDTYQERRIR